MERNMDRRPTILNYDLFAKIHEIRSTHDYGFRLHQCICLCQQFKQTMKNLDQLQRALSTNQDVIEPKNEVVRELGKDGLYDM